MEAAASIPAKMPHVNTLRESVKKAREWVTRAHNKKRGTEEGDKASDSPKDSSDSTDSQDEVKVIND